MKTQPRGARTRATPGARAWPIVVAALLALCAAGAAAQPAPPRIVTTEPVEIGAAAGPHRLRLALFTPAGGPWPAATIAAATREAAAILAQCGIGIEAATLAAYEGDARFADYFTPWSRALARALDPQKPAVFFVAATRNRPAFDAEAVGRANSRMRPELADTVWVAWGARDLPAVLAHELVHVLADSGEHSEEPGNLMNEETAPGATRLEREQCARIVATGEANGLLSR